MRYLLSNRAKHLNEYPELIKQIGTKRSENIFGQENVSVEKEGKDVKDWAVEVLNEAASAPHI